jgi:hypothetical protein
MKKASNTRLSLRKLLLASMAVGPIAVLPAPVWAAVPTAQEFTVTSGSATWSTAGANNGTVSSSSEKLVLVWNQGKFNIPAGDTINFTIPSSGAVLNKVGYEVSGALRGAQDNVAIDGTLFSTGKVFILANGAISIGGVASITTNGGLFLSTLEQGNDFDFLTNGVLGTTGASKGTVTIGGATAPTISGLLDASAGTLVVNQATVTGDVILRSVTAGQALDLAVQGSLAAGGNLTVSTNNGAISGTNAVTSGLQATGNQTASFNTGTTGGVAVNVSNAGNNFEFVTVNAIGAGSNVTLRDSNILTLGASTIGGNLDVTAAGTTDSVAIATNGTVAVTGDAKFTTTAGASGVNIGNNSTVGGSLFGATSNSNFTFNGLGPIKIGGTGINTGTGNRSNISITTNGTLSVESALTTTGNASAGGGITLTAGSITTTATGVINQGAGTGSTVSFNATTGSIAIGATVDASRVAITTAGGNVTQSAIITTRNATTNSPISVGTGTATLTQANSFAAGQTLRVTGASASITNSQNTVLGTSNVTGNLSLTTSGAATIQIGQGLGTAAESINVGGILSATTAGGAITDQDYGLINVFGGLNLTSTGGAITLDAATANGALAPTVRYGVVNANAGAGAISLAETTSLNLGNITTTSTLTARSTTGSIVDSGVLNVTGVAKFIVPAAETVVLDVANHNIGTVVVQGGNANSVLVGAATILGGETSVTGNLTLSSSAGAITLGSAAGTASVTGNLAVSSAGTIIVNNGVSVTGNLALTSSDTTATSITDTATGVLVVTGNTTLKTSGGLTLDSAGNDFTNLVFDGVALDARVDDKTALTVSGTATGLVDVRAGANAGGVAAAWNLQLGNLTAGSLDARAQDGGGGNSGTITQLSGTSLRTEGAASFTTDNANIVINNSGNNFGRVSASTGNGGVTLREMGTLKLGTITTNGTASSITSETGSIIEDTVTATTYTTTNATLTLNAPAGNIQLGRATTTLTAGASTSIVASAPSGSVQLFSSTANLALGNMTANSFSVIHTGTGNLTQSGWVRSFGPASFTSAGNLIISNTTNNFGRVSLIANGAASKNVTITEAGTLNLGKVEMVASATGNFTATSVNGDIIDSGLAGVKPGGTVGAAGSGIVSLSAANGNIILDDPTTDFPTSSTGGVVFNASGNVTLSPLGGTTLWLGTSSQPSTAGNLTVTSATGSINNAGNITVSGLASFSAGNGDITMAQSANQFGSVRFVGKQVSISQTSNMNVQTGSSAIGNASLASTGGNITITNVGGGAVSFGGTANLSASGSIILPKLVQAVGTLSVTAAGTKDLSALSLASDLSSKTPINVGTGTYLPPGQ